MNLIVFVHTCKQYEHTRAKLLENTWANDKDIVFITDNKDSNLNNHIYIGPYETGYTYHPENVKKMFDLLYPIGYNTQMSYFIQQTESFEKWHESVKDLRAKIAIARRIERAEHGNLGDAKTLGSGISEMRIDVGAGYRIYFTVRERVIVILLVGGIKSSQQSDIKKAIQLANEF